MGAGRPSLLVRLQRELASIVSERQGSKLCGFLVVNVLVTSILLLWCNSTNSMALTAFSYLTIFDFCSILTCMVTLWVGRKTCSPNFPFGYGRFEVVAVFTSTLLALLSALFIVKESVERMVEQPEVHTGRLLVGTVVAAGYHLSVTYLVDNPAFQHVSEAASSSWLQEHVADMSHTLCSIVPGLSKLLLPRINPFALIAVAGSVALSIVYVLIDMNGWHAADTWAALWIALMTCGTMLPIAVYSGNILLQTTPGHLLGQLDKVLREAATLDGVLEFRHEHFWTTDFHNMAGSVHVRIRRDADEQLVLAHVVNRLSNIISQLTVQVFKDDWTRHDSYHIRTDSPPGPASPVGPVRLPWGNTDSNQLPPGPASTKRPVSAPALPYHAVAGAAAAARGVRLPFPDVAPVSGLPFPDVVPAAKVPPKVLPYGFSPTATFNPSYIPPRPAALAPPLFPIPSYPASKYGANIDATKPT